MVYGFRTYGSNNGQYNGLNHTVTSNYNIHQYTSNGKLSGYSGSLELNRIVRKGLVFCKASTNSNPKNDSVSPNNSATGGNTNSKNIARKKDVK